MTIHVGIAVIVVIVLYYRLKPKKGLHMATEYTRLDIVPKKGGGVYDYKMEQNGKAVRGVVSKAEVDKNSITLRGPTGRLKITVNEQYITASYRGDQGYAKGYFPLDDAVVDFSNNLTL